MATATIKRRMRKRIRKPVRKARRRLKRVGRRVLPPRITWPYALPAVAPLLEARWRIKVATTRPTTAEPFSRKTGVKEIEELLACQLCGEERFRPLFHPHSKRKGRWNYHVVRCVACDFQYRQPGIRPERLGDLYGKGNYARFLSGHYGARRQARYRQIMDRFSPVFDTGEGRRILDFGCGVGLFLDVAHERGFEPYGVDLSPDSIEVARTKPSGRNAHFGSPMDVPEIAAGGFDAVTLWSVLAHLARPVDDLTMLRGLLNDSGVLLILTVNANSLHLRASLDKWNGFTPNHLVFFSPTTLPLLLRRAGFGAVVMPPMYGDSFEAGKMKISPGYARRMKRTIDRGNRGNMLRAVAFVDAEGPARAGIGEHVTRL